MCFAPQRRALFHHFNFQQCAQHGVLCTFWLPNVLRATTACNFWFLIWPDGSAPAALASLLFDPPELQNIRKTQCFATFLPFHAPASSFFWLFLFSDLLSPSLLFSDSRAPASSFFCLFLFSDFLSSSLLLWLFPPLLFHLSVLSTVWLLDFLRWLCLIRDMTFFVLESALVSCQPRLCYVMMVLVILVPASRAQFVCPLGLFHHSPKDQAEKLIGRSACATSCSPFGRDFSRSGRTWKTPVTTFMWPQFIQEIVIAMKNIGRNIGKASNFGEVGTATEHTAWKFWTVWISIRRDIHYLRARNRTHRSYRVSSREIQWNQSEPKQCNAATHDSIDQARSCTHFVDVTKVCYGVSPFALTISYFHPWPQPLSVTWRKYHSSRFSLQAHLFINQPGFCLRSWNTPGEPLKIQPINTDQACSTTDVFHCTLRNVVLLLFHLPKKGTEKCSALRGRRGH